MKKNISMLLILTFGLIVVACGGKSVKIKSIGIPYSLTISELLKKIHKNDSALPAPLLDSKHANYTNFLGQDITDIRANNTLSDTLNTRIIVLPVKIEGLSIVERSGVEIRECDFQGNLLHHSEKGYVLSIVDTVPENNYAGALLIDPEHLEKLHWIDDANRLQKDICINSHGEDLDKNIQIRKINSEALKIALDEIDAEDEKQ